LRRVSTTMSPASASKTRAPPTNASKHHSTHTYRLQTVKEQAARAPGLATLLGKCCSREARLYIENRGRQHPTLISSPHRSLTPPPHRGAGSLPPARPARRCRPAERGPAVRWPTPPLVPRHPGTPPGIGVHHDISGQHPCRHGHPGPAERFLRIPLA
jgi:hypothetical protein